MSVNVEQLKCEVNKKKVSQGTNEGKYQTVRLVMFFHMKQ